MGGIIGIIQARLGSSRLPGKILAPVAGRPMLELISNRMRRSRVEEWWLATSHDASDDITEAWGHSLGLRVYRGSVDNVLSRFCSIIRDRRPDWIIRVTGDNPFVSPEVVNLLLDSRDEFGKDRSLIELAGDPEGRRTLPLGFGLQLANSEALLASESQIPDDVPHHRSHVLSWLAQSCESRYCPVPDHWPARPNWRWTVDTFEDLAMARSAFALFADQASSIPYCQMVELLDRHPEIADLNDAVSQKALEEG